MYAENMSPDQDNHKSNKVRSQYYHRLAASISRDFKKGIKGNSKQMFTEANKQPLAS